MDPFCYLCVVPGMLSCLFYAAFVVTCWGKAGIFALFCVMFSCVFFVTFPCGVLGQVCYLIVSISALCLLSYFFNDKVGHTVYHILLKSFHQLLTCMYFYIDGKNETNINLE